MKKILMLGTGGTIASEITESGLSPQLTTEQIMHYCPDISDFCSVDCLQLCNLDSTNIAPEHWQRMADSIRKEYNHYDGFVLTHGTDTMAYTAAALSYLIQYSKKPIVLTGSQKPINLEITDSKTNLVDAFHYAANEDAHGVSIVFNGRVILGTRARKTHSKSFHQAQSDRVHPRVHQDHLLDQAQERRHPPPQREHRRHDGRELPQASRGRDRHLPALPGDLQPQGLRGAASEGTEVLLSKLH